MISSIEAGKSGSSSTEIMCSAAPSRLASSHPMASALKPPSEPSFATTIRVNTSDLLPCGADLRQEPFLGDQGRHHRTRDYGRQQDRILLLVDNLIGETVERRDRPECKAGRHQQRRINAVATFESKYSGQRQNADEFGQHLEAKEQCDEPGASHQRLEFNQRASLEKIERRQDRKRHD